MEATYVFQRNPPVKLSPSKKPSGETLLEPKRDRSFDHRRAGAKNRPLTQPKIPPITMADHLTTTWLSARVAMPAPE